MDQSSGPVTGFQRISKKKKTLEDFHTKSLDSYNSNRIASASLSIVPTVATQV